jgi:integration host factor subunit alpha
VAEALLNGGNVKLSSFGSFMLRKKGLRVGRNPKTGVEVPIQPRTVLSFRPSQLLRQKIND